MVAAVVEDDAVNENDLLVVNLYAVFVQQLGVGIHQKNLNQVEDH